MSYKTQQYKMVQSIIEKGKIFGDDIGGGVFRKKVYTFVLEKGINNLYPPFQNEMVKYFSQNKIAWWGGNAPTNHTLSSQIACMNHLFPVRHDRDAVLTIIRNVIPDIVDVLMIENDAYNPAYIQFESVSDTDHLNEVTSTRGSNCTSIDALIYAKHKNGRNILVLIEWKFVEKYGNSNKASGDKGVVRKKRYTDLINNSNQLKNNSHEVYYYEPFYQLMRQTLWAEQIIANNKTETVKVDDYIHLHIIPKENAELLRKKYLCSGKYMEDTWRACINDQKKYKIITPCELLEPIDRQKYKELLNYLQDRYW